MWNFNFRPNYILAIALLPLLASLSFASAHELKADRVLVKKSERKLYLLMAGEVIGEYTVSLGSNPTGHKQQQGDKRTPEGTYILKHRNPRSKFFKSILLSYPKEEDRRRAEALGIDPEKRAPYSCPTGYR